MGDWGQGGGGSRKVEKPHCQPHRPALGILCSACSVSLRGLPDPVQPWATREPAAGVAAETPLPSVARRGQAPLGALVSTEVSGSCLDPCVRILGAGEHPLPGGPASGSCRESGPSRRVSGEGRASGLHRGCHAQPTEVPTSRGWRGGAGSGTRSPTPHWALAPPWSCHPWPAQGSGPGQRGPGSGQVKVLENGLSVVVGCRLQVSKMLCWEKVGPRDRQQLGAFAHRGPGKRHLVLSSSEEGGGSRAPSWRQRGGCLAAHHLILGQLPRRSLCPTSRPLPGGRQTHKGQAGYSGTQPF